MSAHRSIFMVARARGTGYRQVTRPEATRMLDAGIVRFEGVDGDEDANTVTYWYTRDLEV